jgi:hypothetical protein
MSYTPTLDPIFTGNVRVPTATAGDNGNRAASTAFVTDAVVTAVGAIDLSNLVTLDTVQTVTGEKTFAATTHFTGGSGISIAATSGGITRVGTDATSNVLGATVTGDVALRFNVTTAGSMEWGTGASGADVTLSRTAANVLSLGADDFLRAATAPVHADDLTNKAYVDTAVGAVDLSNLVTLDTAQTITASKTFSADTYINNSSYLILNSGASQNINGGTLGLQAGSAEGERRLYTRISGDPQDRFQLTSGGHLLWGDGNTAPDVTITRTGANVISLGADDYLRAAASPLTNNDLTNKAYVDAVAQGLQLKQSVRAATTEDIALENEQTVDGVALVAGDRVLVKNQTDAEDNGIYVVVDGGSWIRAEDLDEPAELTSGIFTFVEEGGVNGDAGFVVTTNNPITLGVDPVVWTQFSGAGQIIAGTAIQKVGNQLNVLASRGIDLGTNAVAIDENVVVTLDTAQIFTTSKNWIVDGIQGPIIETAADGDTHGRYYLRADGTQEWGSGFGLPDVYLTRSEANVLTLGADDFLRAPSAPVDDEDVANKLYVDSAVGAVDLSTLVTLGTAQNITGAKIFSGTTTHHGELLVVGASGGYVTVQGTGMYLPNTNIFMQQDSGIVVTDSAEGIKWLTVSVSGDAEPRFSMDNTGMMEWSDGSGFGGPDVSLERTAENVLSLGTNDYLRAAAVPVHADDLTNKAYVDAAVGAVDLTGYVTLDTAQTLTGVKTLEGAAASSEVLNVSIDGEDQPRFYIKADGTLGWGDGTTDSSYDVLSFDYNSGVVMIDGGLEAYGLTSTAASLLQGGVSVEGKLDIRASGNAHPRVLVDDSNYRLHFGPGNAAPNVSLGRSSEMTFGLEWSSGYGYFAVNGGMLASAGASRVAYRAEAEDVDSAVFQSNLNGPTVFRVMGDGKMLWGGGLDTNLYRESANVLKTDDTFVVAGSELIVSNTLLVDGGTTTAGLSVVGLSSLAGRIELNGGIKYQAITVSDNHTVNLDSDYIILVDTDAAAGGVTVTLPASHIEGQVVVVKDSGGAGETKNITVATADSDTVDGLTNFVIDVNYMAVSFVSDGFNWFAI